MGKLTKTQQAKIYCIKNGHSNYITRFWGYVHCGRCEKQIGDTLAGSFPCDKYAVIGCKDSPCNHCDPIISKLNQMDKEIFNKLKEIFESENSKTHEEILEDIEIK